MVSWYSVRCIFSIGVGCFEERITLWQADSSERAIELAEDEARAYAADTEGRYLKLAQSFELYDEPLSGGEIFSLIRTSALDDGDYLTKHFSDGSEHGRHI